MSPLDTAAPDGGRFDEAGDATRRTHLANERTYLAWWRTGLTAFAVSIGTGRVVPALTKHDRWPYAIVGGGFAILGIMILGYGLRRQRAVDEAISRGAYARPDERITLGLTAAGIVLGLALLLIVAL